MRLDRKREKKMRNKGNLGRLVLLVSCVWVILSGNAFAKIKDIYMTNSAGSFLERDSFGEDETPWLFLKLKKADDQVEGDWWFWNKGNQGGQEFSFDTADPSPNLEIEDSVNSDGTKYLWLTRKDIDNVKASKHWWHIYAHSGNSGAAKYRVTPEPVSSALFLLGAGALAGVRRLRKK